MKCWEGTIRAGNIHSVTKKLDALNRRCSKLGIDKLEASFSEPRREDDKKKRNFNLLVVDVVISGEEPRIDGWEPLAVFQREGELVLVREFPDKEHERFYPTSIKCDHCKTNRFRKSSIVMRNTESGEIMEVGTSCVKDFIGYSPDAWLFWASLGADVGDAIENFERNAPSDDNYAFDLERFLAMTSAAIKKFGWVSKTAAYNDPEGQLTPTVSAVIAELRPPMGYRPELEPDADDEKTAKETIEHFTTCVDDSNYAYTAKQVVKLGYVPWPQTGLVCSLVASYQNALKKDVERKAAGVSEYVGEAKQRLRDIELQLVHVGGFAGNFGWTNIYLFKDAAGNMFKWFSTNSIDMEIKDKCLITGTVKGHEEYKDVKYTVLTRCKAEPIKIAEEVD